MRNVTTAKMQFFYDGIQYCMLMVEMANKRLEIALLSLSTDPSDSEQVLSAVTDSWLIIDAVHRLRSLLRQTPGLKQKTSELQSFFRRTARVEELRNAVQHLNHQFNSYVRSEVGPWGALTWVTPVPDDNHTFMSYLLVPGGVRPTRHTILTPYPPEMRYPICLITLTAMLAVCITHVAESCDTLRKYLTGAAPETFSQSPRFLCAALEFSDVPKDIKSNGGDRG